MAVTNYLSTFLKDEATGLVTSFVGNYAAAPYSAIYAPAAGTIALIHSMHITIEDAGSPDSGKYGNNITLTNGIKFQVTDDTEILNDLTNGGAVLTNGDYARYANVDAVTFGTGNTFVTVSHNFTETGAPLVLHGDHQEKFEVIFNDDFTELVSQTIYITGVVVPDNRSYRSRIHSKYLITD